MKRYVKSMVIVFFCLVTVAMPAGEAKAGIYEIIKAIVVKAIKAADLAIQRQQNKVIWLQNAQKVLENTLSKLRLDEISEWTEKQKEQYQKYFDELRKVKLLISYYQRIRDISETQFKLVEEYGRVWRLITSDKHFTIQELQYMGRVYSGILSETAKNVDQLAMVVNSFRTQMSDAKRLEIINAVAERVENNYSDLKAFNAENGMLSLQRAKSEADAATVKQLYGLQ